MTLRGRGTQNAPPNGVPHREPSLQLKRLSERANEETAEPTSADDAGMRRSLSWFAAVIVTLLAFAVRPRRQHLCAHERFDRRRDLLVTSTSSGSPDQGTFRLWPSPNRAAARAPSS